MTELKTTILSVNDLRVSFATEEGKVRVLDGVSFNLHRGETLGLVGESGCGKSVAAFSIMRLLPQPAGRIEGGSIQYEGQDLLHLDIAQMHRIRGRKIGMIFQEPMTALNPVHPLGKQLGEVYRLHFPRMTDKDIRRECIALLDQVGIPAPERRLREYPHQLSGGMRQRAMIAIALACKPDILIADEPTTALDVTTQNQILSLMQDLQQELGMAIIFITHDLGVIAQMCDRVLVMYAGRIVEQAPVRELFERPCHPYSRGLLSSIPKLDTRPKTDLPVIRGMVPPLTALPSGCRFRSRCDWQIEACAEIDPQLEAVTPPTAAGASHSAACIRWREVDAGQDAKEPAHAG